MPQNGVVRINENDLIEVDQTMYFGGTLNFRLMGVTLFGNPLYVNIVLNEKAISEAATFVDITLP